MRKLTATFCFTIAVLIGSIGVSESGDLQRGAIAYQNGDYVTALREFKTLAKQGNAQAQAILGIMYREGRAVPQDYKTAVKWFTLAAKQESVLAQLNLGVMYATGDGFPQDFKTAVKWYRLAAEQGYAPAQSKLGASYSLGRGVIQDNVYAHMWANIGASNGDKEAIKIRDIIAKRMTSADISTAQKLARECIRKKYKGC